MKPHKYLLLSVFIVALILRLFKVAEVPACLNWDEAAFGYNAFSILETGKDEYGTPYPIEFKSIGDYKLPVYIYMMVPVIKLFGLNEFSVRLLPGLLGAMSVFPLYFLALRISKSREVALIASFFLAISPWHIQFTRAGADVGVSTFFTITGIYLLVRSIQEKNKGFTLPATMFLIAMYTYFSDRVFVPIFIMSSSLFFHKELVKKYQKVLYSAVFSLLLLIPLVFNIFSQGQSEKLTKTTVIGLSRSSEYVENLKKADSKLEMLIYHSEFFEKALGILDRYVSHFSPQFLFSLGAGYDLRQMIYGMGVMYLFDLPLIILGILSIIKKRDKHTLFLLLWLLVAPIPASITRDPVHARRSINMVYPILIISSIGAVEFTKWLKTKRNIFKTILTFSSIGVLLFAMFFYVISYFVFTPKRVLKGPAGFNCGYKELVSYVNSLDKKYDKIVIDTDYQGPYLYFLFYNSYPPEKYQPQAKLIAASPDSLGEGAGFENYEFRQIYWPDDRSRKNALFAGSPDSLPTKDVEETGKIIKKIYFYNGEVAFIVVETPK